MKPLFAFALVASLALNAVVLTRAFRPRAIEPLSAPLSARPSAPVSPEPRRDGSAWADFASDDLSHFAAHLRTAGVPPDLLRAIVAAKISESFAARRQALSADSAALAYWKNPSTDPALTQQLRQLDREEQKQLREVLGPDAESDDALNRVEQANLAFLPPEKSRDVLTVLRDHQDRLADLSAAGITFQTDRETLRALDREQHDRIAQLLTPAELLDYDLRTSNTARDLRTNLDVFQPTEAEFRLIYQLREPIDERFRSEMTFSANSPAAEVEKLIIEQIKATLGPQRGAEYERATDYNYRRTSQLVTRLQLPPATVDQLWSMQKEFEQRRQNLPPAAREERQQQLAALQQEATARLTPLLGDVQNIDAYKQYGGQWLQSMTPRPAPPAAPPK